MKIALVIQLLLHLFVLYSFSEASSLDECIKKDRIFYNKIRTLYNELFTCMKGKAVIGDATNCRGNLTRMAWPQCNNIDLQICNLQDQRNLEYQQCRLSINAQSIQKNDENKYSNIAKYAYDKYNKASEIYDAISNPKEFIKGALQEKYESFLGSSPLLRSNNPEISNEAYGAIYDFAKFGISKTNDPLIQTIQNANLERISNHFNGLMNQFDSVLLDIKSFDFPSDSLALSNAYSSIFNKDRSSADINKLDQLKSDLFKAESEHVSKSDNSWNVVKSNQNTNLNRYNAAKSEIDSNLNNDSGSSSNYRSPLMLGRMRFQGSDNSIEMPNHQDMLDQANNYPCEKIPPLDGCEQIVLQIEEVDRCINIDCPNSHYSELHRQNCLVLKWQKEANQIVYNRCCGQQSRSKPNNIKASDVNENHSDPLGSDDSRGMLFRGMGKCWYETKSTGRVYVPCPE